MDYIQQLFSSNSFMPHGCCYMWNNALIGLHVISDGLITLAYYSIPLTLIYFVRKRKDLAFDWIYICFAIFIVACGTTHLMEIINIWHSNYWLSGAIKGVTATVSVVTAILLVGLVPKALAVPSPEALRQANKVLQKEIAERKLAEERSQKLNNDLQIRTAQLEAANKELEAFSYSVSHDLRAPLRHIDGFIDLLKTETSPDLSTAGQQYLSVISNSARQMGTLIDDLLIFSRMSRAEMQPRPVKMDQLLKESQIEVMRDAEGRTIDWKIAPLPEMRIDETLFRQIWLNLLSNAVKYTRNRSRAEIAVDCVDRGHEYEFSVKDNGAGFDMKYASKLFGIFQRLHRQDEFEGNGIGLANVRRIVARHGGRTWAEAAVDAGATFYFTLPKTL